MLETGIRVACASMLLLGCAERTSSATAPPHGNGRPESSSGSSSSSQCPAGGPSVAINVRGYAGGQELPRETLGTVLGWIGGFAQPCREAPAAVPQFTLEVTLPEAGQAPTFELLDRAALPDLAACLDANFAQAPPPPPEPMIVEITIPWGCPTLAPGAAPSGPGTEASTNAPSEASTDAPSEASTDVPAEASTDAPEAG